MHTLNKSVYAFAVGLSALAGCVDAIGFLHLGGYFISFMSGNSTRLAVNLVEGNLHGVALVGSIIALFVIGTMLGVFVRHYLKAPPVALCVLGFVTLLLFGAALSHELGWDFVAIIFMILAMGAENAIFQRNGEVMMGLTYMTGSLVKVGQRLAHAMLGGAKYTWIPYLLLWAGLIAGGALGTLLFYQFGLRSLWIAIIWAAGLSLIATWQKHRFELTS